jgi:hypothetical protein
MVEITHRDNNQIACYEHDENVNAKRVVLVGGEIMIPEVKFPDSIKMDVKVIEIVKEVPVIVEKVVIKEVEKPIYIDRFVEKEVEKIVYVDKIVNTVTEIPVIKEVTTYKEIEKPVLIEKTKIVEIEKPVIIKQVEIKEVEKTITLYKYPWWFVLVSTIVAVSGWLSHIIK